MKTKLNVKGMHCKSCEMLINDALQDEGVKSQVNVKKGEVVVDFDESKIKLEKIKSIIKKEGYNVD